MRGAAGEAQRIAGARLRDGLVHHATILEMNVESYRRKAALERKRAPARQSTPRATTKAAS